MCDSDPSSPMRRKLLRASIVLPLAGMGGIHAAAVPSSGAMLALPWQDSLNPADFLVSEKLDGVRAVWDGQTLRFRSGRHIAAPDWLVNSLPLLPLDGELWGGRHSFDTVSGAVRRAEPVEAQWKGLRYMVFDAPDAAVPFARRAERVQEVVDSLHLPWLQAVEQGTIKDVSSLHRQLNQVVAAGGEGLVLHRRDGLWTPGRNDALRKLKPVPDEEGVVLAHIAGTGKYQGKMGALLVRAPDGQQFALGTGFTDVQRSHPPAVGAVVTYRYRDRTASGLPRFASFLRMRDEE